MSKAASRSVNKSAISTIVAVILTAVIVGSVVGGAVYAYFALQFAPAQQLASQPKPALQKLKVGAGIPTGEGFFLVADAGKEQGIWAKNGLDPEFTFFLGGGQAVKGSLGSGIKIGISTTTAALQARATGAPIKIVAGYIGEGTNRLYVKADSTLKTVMDLDGKKVGVANIPHADYSQLLLLSKKFGIKAEAIPLGGNITTMVVALKLGRIDAFIASSGAVLRLVDSGELKILVRMSDILLSPRIGGVVWATEDLIEQNPDLVRKFVKATLETVKFLKDNPSSAAELYIKRSNAPRDLAEKVVFQVDWTPSGRGRGSDLLVALANNLQTEIEVGEITAGSIRVEDAVDVRFLP